LPLEFFGLVIIFNLLNYMGLKIQFASDLHLEFPQNRDLIRSKPLQPVGDVLVLAGDVVPFCIMKEYDDFFNYLSDHFEQTYWLPGNHEYYHFDIATKCGEINDRIKSNVTLVNNVYVNHNGVRILFTTLWSQISQINQWKIERSMNDFHLINFNGGRFTAEHYNALHCDSLDFIKRSINVLNGERVVVFSHHCPTFLNYPPQFKGDVLNEGFATELYDLIESSEIGYWGFGHHHYNIPEFQIGETRLVTNQMGYVQQREHESFDYGGFIIL
jgi:predicted phosphohydrolase